MDFPIITDPLGRISAVYDMIDQEDSDNRTIRSVFFIDPHMYIRAMINYPASIGRSTSEILRVVDALQKCDELSDELKGKVLTPSDWKVAHILTHTNNSLGTLRSSIRTFPLSRPFTGQGSDRLWIIFVFSNLSWSRGDFTRKKDRPNSCRKLRLI